MKFLSFATLLAVASIALALNGQLGIPDPSTAALCDGKYYVWGTGGPPLVSDDGWTWRAGVRPPRTGAAPDVIHIGDKYFMYVVGGGAPNPNRLANKNSVVMLWNKTLNPDSVTLGHSRITVQVGAQRYPLNIPCQGVALPPESVPPTKGRLEHLQVQTRFLHLLEPARLGDRIDGWRVCWVGGWDKCKLLVVMVERVVRAAQP